MPDITHVLSENYKGMEWTLNGEPTTEVEFKKAFTLHKANGHTVPTWDKLQKQLAEMQADYDSKQYQRNRKPEYGSWEEQLDMMYHGTWESHVQAVKDKYPKE